MEGPDGVGQSIVVLALIKMKDKKFDSQDLHQ